MLNAEKAVSVDRLRIGHFGVLRAVAALPPMVGSTMLLLVLFGWLGRWEGLVLSGWLAVAVTLSTRAGERVVVRVGFRFRRPTISQASMLQPVWRRALNCCGTDPGAVDLYIRASSDSNAYAVGGRSIAVTSGAIAEHRAHRLTDGHLIAMLVHELGHHATGGARHGLALRWLAAPWRYAARPVVAVVVASARRQRPRVLAAVIVVGVVLAIVQAVQAGQWAVAAVLSTVTALAVLCPVGDAALSRRTEFAADRYAAAAGVGSELTAALQALDGGHVERGGWVARMLRRHPETARRIAAVSELPTT